MINDYYIMTYWPPMTPMTCWWLATDEWGNDPVKIARLPVMGNWQATRMGKLLACDNLPAYNNLAGTAEG